jgi:hypothetical protein
MGFWGWLRRLLGHDEPPVPVTPHRNSAVPRDVVAVTRELISRCWKFEPGMGQRMFLDPRQTIVMNHEEFLASVLEHVRRVCQKIDVPRFRPRILVTDAGSAAGRFVEEDGWITIELNEKYFNNRASSQSIICHEVCHYILEFNGIRKPVEIDNEVMTDVAMFVFGLGDVFLTGYQPKNLGPENSVVRLGYLSKSEYKNIKIMINEEIEKNKDNILDESDALLVKIKARLLGDKKKLNRYITHMDQKYPSWSRQKKFEEILRQLER